MTTANDPRRIDYADFVAEWKWVWSRHEGDIVRAAPIFGIKPSSLESRLARARQAGHDVAYTNTSKRVGA